MEWNSVKFPGKRAKRVELGDNWVIPKNDESLAILSYLSNWKALAVLR